jgi:hypothetical protein
VHNSRLGSSLKRHGHGQFPSRFSHAIHVLAEGNEVAVASVPWEAYVLKSVA